MIVEYNVYVAYCVERHYIPERGDDPDKEEWDTVLDYSDTEDSKLGVYDSQEEAEEAGCRYLP